MATRSPRIRRGSVSSRRPSGSRRRRTSSRQSRTPSATWRPAARWIASSPATSGTARPRSRSAPPSRRSATGCRSRCWCRRRCWLNSSGPRSPTGSGRAGHGGDRGRAARSAARRNGHPPLQPRRHQGGARARARAGRPGLLRPQPGPVAAVDGEARPGAGARGARDHGPRPDEGARARGDHGEVRHRSGRRARLHRHRRVRAGHPGVQHDHHQPCGPFRARPVLSAAGTRRARATAGVRLSAGSGRRPGRRAGTATPASPARADRARLRVQARDAGPGDPGRREPPGGPAARPHRRRRLRSLFETPGRSRARIGRPFDCRSGRSGHQRGRGRVLVRRICARGQSAPRSVQTPRRRNQRGRGCRSPRRAGRPLRPLARRGRAATGHRAHPRGRPRRGHREGRGGRRQGPGHVLRGDHAGPRASRPRHPAEPGPLQDEARVHARGDDLAWRVAAGSRLAARHARRSGARVIGRLARPALLMLALAGCSVPQWMPLIGEKPTKDEPPKAAPATSAVPVRLSTVSKTSTPDDRVTDRVLAVVNNDAITLSELQEAIAVYQYENRDRAQEAPTELAQQFLTRMIDTRLQIQEAEREKIVIDDAEVEEELAERLKKMNVKSRDEFEALLKGQGLSMESVKRRIRDELRRGRIVGRKVRLRVSVMEAEVMQYLEANRAKLETGLTYHARHILILPDAGVADAAWENARIRADLLRGQLLQGADFAELAQQNSRDASARDGGDLGTLKRGELAQDIEPQILSLAVAEVSLPFRSALGYHIFRLESKDSLEGEGLTRVKAQIREILFREKFDARLDAWLKEIKQRAIIDVRLDGQP